MLEFKSSSSPLFSSKLVIIVLVLLALAVPLSAKADSQPAPDSYVLGNFQFCPKGKAFGDASCSTVRQYMDDAIADAYTAAQNNVSGTIYAGAGSYTGGNGDVQIDLSGFNFGTSLVIQGGIGGGTTTFVRQLNLDSNADLDFTLMDVTVQIPTYTEHGIRIYNNTGKYLLENVAIYDSNYGGIFVNQHTGDVTLQTVEVDNSAQTNIDIENVEGSVVLDDIFASNSQTGQGVELYNILGKNGVKLIDVEAYDNYANNFYIFGITGDATLLDCETSGTSNGYGVNIDVVHGKKGVIIENTNSVNSKMANFYIQNINNAVAMENVTANDSVNGAGIYLVDIEGKKGASLKTVEASGNKTYNIRLTDFEFGAILSGINANNGGGEGIYANNIRGTKGVSISGANVNTNNSNNIRIIDLPNGPVSLTDVFANESSTDKGIQLQNIGGSKGVKFSNVIAGANYGYNLDVEYITGDFSYKTGECSDSISNMGINLYTISGMKGVSISGVEASNNAEMNIGISTISGNVSLTGVTANESANNRGINILYVNGPKGVTLKGVTADGNYNENIVLSNILGNAVLSGISAQNSAQEEGIVISLLAGSKGITLSGANTNSNWKDGMNFYDITGNIKMKDIQSSSNIAGLGIELSNIDGSKGISLANITADGNDQTNIFATDVDGSASLKTINASHSENESGVHLVNIFGIKGVKMSGVTAETNEDGNVALYTISGSVSLKDITANGSVNSVGVSLHKIYGSKGIKASGIAASSNGSYNIYINDITGDVSLSNVTATDGGIGGGGYIYNIGGLKGVMIKTADFSSADQTNLEVRAVSGYAVFSDVTANLSVSGNGLKTVDIDGVLMIMNSFFNGNNQKGIEVIGQDSQISINNVFANESTTSDGAYLDSTADQLICSSTFNDNSAFGIESYTHSNSLTTSLVTADGNGTFGISHSGALWTDTTKCKVIPVPPP